MAIHMQSQLLLVTFCLWFVVEVAQVATVFSKTHRKMARLRFYSFISCGDGRLIYRNPPKPSKNINTTNIIFTSVMSIDE